MGGQHRWAPAYMSSLANKIVVVVVLTVISVSPCFYSVPN